MSESVSSSTTINASAKQILAVLTDVETYPQWAKAVKSVNVIDADSKGRPKTVEFEVTPGPLPKVRYVLQYTHKPDKLSWTFVEGDMISDMSGSYSLVDSGDTTSVTYDLTIDVNFPIPGFVKSRAARELTKVALEELKRRVESP